jgi:hypothetical protein
VYRHQWWHVGTTISGATGAIHGSLRAGTAFMSGMGQWRDWRQALLNRLPGDRWRLTPGD